MSPKFLSFLLLQRPSFFLSQNQHFLGSVVLPWFAMVLPLETGYYCTSASAAPARYYLTQRGSNFLLPLDERYYRPASGRMFLLPLSVRYYRDDVRYYRAVGTTRGLKTGKGGSNSRIPILSLSSCGSLSPLKEQRRRTSPDRS